MALLGCSCLSKYALCIQLHYNLHEIIFSQKATNLGLAWLFDNDFLYLYITLLCR